MRVLLLFLLCLCSGVACADEWKVHEFSTDKFQPLDDYFRADAVIYYHLEVPKNTPQSGGFNGVLELSDASGKVIEVHNDQYVTSNRAFMKDWSEWGGRHVRERFRVVLPKATQGYRLKISVSAYDENFDALTTWSQTVALRKRTQIAQIPTGAPIEIQEVVARDSAKTKWALALRKRDAQKDERFEMVREVGSWDYRQSYFWTLESHGRQFRSNYTWGFGRRYGSMATWRTEIELGSQVPQKGELWLRGRISVDGSWPQDIQIPLRDLTGEWISNPEKWAVIRPAPPR